MPKTFIVINYTGTIAFCLFPDTCVIKSGFVQKMTTFFAVASVNDYCE